MTKAVKILTDSSIQLTPEEIEKYKIEIVPLSIEIEGKTYVDGVDITRAELINKLHAKKFPKTSQPALGKFVEAYDRLGADGSEVLAIVLSDVLSGTFETAQTAAKMTTTKVTVINSKSTDRGLAFQVIAAAQDLEAGKTIPEIQQHCREIFKRTRVNVLIDTLDYLVKGGRVSRFAGAVTKLINLKVIVELREESLDVVVKGRSRKTFIKFCEKLAAYHKEKNPIQELALSHADAAQEFLERIKNILLPADGVQVDCLEKLTSPIIMTHTGLYAVGIITLSEKTEPAEI
ncbi:DegV family protein [Liquorilactobacillus satsumensis]|uniref:DegV family protein n=1 Tax=Liquorilactobacillus satsumensis DSM 16230 = JCM 12392 TaxID=1423801 RepID=A0A0R1V6B3_9LACO|nr:DegV family protein [Liquorilactobacillus satsumensis]KRL98501.1 DegV family protein [Liquorilactobacillus satsumensis DSM 16230 = JCM 12392]MCC7666017.1 DegV family protein [Liquorilactobacillus satsumensis]MCP9313081.1 DegV family protein [Liquorilactobacillus satsumensis]MCP9329346.1 DegV family protein [Liquorilactobacillus satsumensis]MCP9358655.1 DegV family protein [Liquorilactobacillus satsumensis]